MKINRELRGFIMNNNEFDYKQKSNIKYIGELVLMSESDLKNIKNLGKRSFDEIASKLLEVGYKIGDDLPNDLVITLNKRLAKLKGQN